VWWVGVFHSLASYSYLLLQQCKGKGVGYRGLQCNIIILLWELKCHMGLQCYLPPGRGDITVCVSVCVCVFHNSACYSYCLLPQCVMTWEYSVTCHPAEVTFLCVCKCVCVSVFYNSACYSYCSLSHCICVCDCISAVSVRHVPTS